MVVNTTDSQKTDEEKRYAATWQYIRKWNNIYQYAYLFRHSQSTLNLSTFRAQDGNTGRWINRDLLSEKGGLNLYSYAAANSVNFIDSTGLCAQNNGPRDRNKFCTALLASIVSRGATLIGWIADYNPITDGMGGFPMRGGKLTKPGGHYQKITELQSRLQRDVRTYTVVCINGSDDDDSGSATLPIPADVQGAVDETLPKPVIFPDSSPDSQPPTSRPNAFPFFPFFPIPGGHGEVIAPMR